MAKFTFHYFLTSSILSMVIGAAVLQDISEKSSGHKGNVLLDAKTPKDKKIKFPYYVSGFDYDDQPVIVMEWGRWDIRSLVEEGGKDVRDFETSVDQFADMVKDDFFIRNYNTSGVGALHWSGAQTLGIVVIIDFDGLNLRQIATPESMRLLLKSFGKLERCHGQFAYGIIVNANPIVHQVIQLATPFMGKFLERTTVYGTNPRKYIPSILKRIPQSQLHPIYGGAKGFKPIAIYSLM